MSSPMLHVPTKGKWRRLKGKNYASIVCHVRQRLSNQKRILVRLHGLKHLPRSVFAVGSCCWFRLVCHCVVIQGNVVSDFVRIQPVRCQTGAAHRRSGPTDNLIIRKVLYGTNATVGFIFVRDKNRIWFFKLAWMIDDRKFNSSVSCLGWTMVSYTYEEDRHRKVVIVRDLQKGRQDNSIDNALLHYAKGSNCDTGARCGGGGAP